MESRAFDPTTFLCKKHNKGFSAVELNNFAPKLLCEGCMKHDSSINVLDVKECFTEDAIKDICESILGISDIHRITANPKVKSLLKQVDENFNKLILALNEKKAEFRDKVLTFLIETGNFGMGKDQVLCITQKLETLLNGIKKENRLAEDSAQVIEYCQLFNKLNDCKKDQLLRMQEIDRLSKLFVQKLETYLVDIDQQISACLVPNRDDFFQYVNSGGQAKDSSLSTDPSSLNKKKINFWNAKSAGLPADIVSTVVISPNNLYIASGSNDGMISIWEAIEMKPVISINDAHKGSVTTLKYTPDSSTLISGGEEGNLKLWDPVSGACVKAFTDHGHKKKVYSLAIDSRGNSLISVGGDNTIRVFDIRRMRNVRVIENAHADNRIYLVDIIPDNKYFMTCAYDGIIKVWNFKTYALEFKIKSQNDLITKAPNSRLLSDGEYIFARGNLVNSLI